MGRTAEQKAADEALHEAVWAAIKAMPHPEGEDPPEAAGVLTKFLVLAIQVRFDDNGAPTDALNMLYSNGSMLGFEAEGILKQADRVYAQDGYRRSAGYREEGD